MPRVPPGGHAPPGSGDGRRAGCRGSGAARASPGRPRSALLAARRASSTRLGKHVPVGPAGGTSACSPRLACRSARAGTRAAARAARRGCRRHAGNVPGRGRARRSRPGPQRLVQDEPGAARTRGRRRGRSARRSQRACPARSRVHQSQRVAAGVPRPARRRRRPSRPSRGAAAGRRRRRACRWSRSAEQRLVELVQGRRCHRPRGVEAAPGPGARGARQARVPGGLGQRRRRPRPVAGRADEDQAEPVVRLAVARVRVAAVSGRRRAAAARSASAYRPAVSAARPAPTLRSGCRRGRGAAPPPSTARASGWRGGTARGGAPMR